MSNTIHSTEDLNDLIEDANQVIEATLTAGEKTKSAIDMLVAEYDEHIKYYQVKASQWAIDYSKLAQFSRKQGAEIKALRAELANFVANQES